MPHVLLFLLTSIAITVMPGPDNLQVIARGASQGRKAGLAAAAGFASGCLFHTTLAALGLALALAAYISQQAAEAERKIVYAVKIALTISQSGAYNDPRCDGLKREMLQSLRL